jgi:hypothetical protein
MSSGDTRVLYPRVPLMAGEIGSCDEKLRPKAARRVNRARKCSFEARVRDARRAFCDRHGRRRLAMLMSCSGIEVRSREE